MALPTVLAGCHEAETKREAADRAPPNARLVRIGYLVGETYQYLDVDTSFDWDPDLIRIPSKPQSKPALIFEVLVGPTQENLLILDDGEPTGPRLPRKALSHPLCEALRGVAFSKLRDSMATPRRKLDWHALALAKYLQMNEYDAPAVGIVPGDVDFLLAKLDESPNLEPVAVALIRLSPRSIPDEAARRFANDDRIALRLIPLVRAARLGDRQALTEIFRLSLEYHSALPLFVEAAQALFARLLNEDLYRDHPPGPDGPASAGFLNSIGVRLRDANYDEGTLGWTFQEVTEMKSIPAHD